VPLLLPPESSGVIPGGDRRLESPTVSIGNSIVLAQSGLSIDPYFRQAAIPPAQIFNFSPIRTGENPPSMPI